jgi:hypothetical protein
MKLATILGLYFLTVSWLAAGVSASTLAESGASPTQGATTSQSQPAATQPPAAPPAAAQPAATTPTQTRPVVKRRAAPKKAIYPDCTTSPTPLNPVLANPKYPKRSPDTAQSGAGQTNNAAGASSANAAGNSNAGSSVKNKTAPLKPCPPPKKVVRNGGSDDPKIELLGGTPAQQASNERSTEEITAATEENLKKITGRELTTLEQDTVSQIKQFMKQSKEAVASGSPDRGRNLALKAKLLSDELVKP